MVAPLLILMLMGIMCYGGYFWMAHAVQQVANDAARTTISGLSADERASLARGTFDSEIGQYAYLTPAKASLAVNDQNQVVTVNVAYDASTTPFFMLNRIVPMPPATITRSATIRLGGY